MKSLILISIALTVASVAWAQQAPAPQANPPTITNGTEVSFQIPTSVPETTLPPNLKTDMQIKNFKSEQALGGVVNGGGGDPQALEFIEYGKKVASWLMLNPHPAIDINDARLVDDINSLEKTLDSHSPAIRFPQVYKVNCFGSPKSACTNNDRTIDVASLSWSASSPQERCTLAAMELFVPQQIQSRYEKAGSICQIIYPNKNTSTEATTRGGALEQGCRVVTAQSGVTGLEDHKSFFSGNDTSTWTYQYTYQVIGYSFVKNSDGSVSKNENALSEGTFGDMDSAKAEAQKQLAALISQGVCPN